MDQARMLVYELLAGHVNHVIPQMQLDWRRALALHLWCASTLVKHGHGCIQQSLSAAFICLYCSDGAVALPKAWRGRFKILCKSAPARSLEAAVVLQ